MSLLSLACCVTRCIVVKTISLDKTLESDLANDVVDKFCSILPSGVREEIDGIGYLTIVFRPTELKRKSLQKLKTIDF